MSDERAQVRLTPLEKAMSWERMSGCRLLDAERQHVLDGGEFVPPTNPVSIPMVGIDGAGHGDSYLGCQYIPDPAEEAWHASPEGLRSTARSLRAEAARMLEKAQSLEEEACDKECSPEPGQSE